MLVRVLLKILERRRPRILQHFIPLLPSKYKHHAQPDQYFEADPWMCKPSPEWNSPSYWDHYYDTILNDAKNVDRRDRLQRQACNQVLSMCRYLGEWPLSRVLCAGCGIAAEPQLFAWLGYQVTAIDLSPSAIRWAQTQKWTVDALAKSIDIFEEVDSDRHTYNVIVDAERAQAVLEARRHEGGMVNRCYRPQLPTTRSAAPNRPFLA